MKKPRLSEGVPRLQAESAGGFLGPAFYFALQSGRCNVEHGGEGGEAAAADLGRHGALLQ